MIYGTAVTYLKYGEKPQLYQYENISKIIQTPKITDPLLCKTLERMVNARLTWYLETNKLITEYQSCFRSQRSPMDHLIQLETFIRQASIKKEHLVAVFFQSQKSIPHNLEMRHCKRSEKPQIRRQNANIYPKLPSR